MPFSAGYGTNPPVGAEHREARTPPGVRPSDGRSRSGERYQGHGSPHKRMPGKSNVKCPKRGRSGNRKNI